MVLVVAIAVFAIRINNPSSPTKEETLQKYGLIKSQYDTAKANGYDVSKAERLGLEAKKAYDIGNYKETNRLLDLALAALEKTTKPAGISIPPISNTSFIPTSKIWIYDGAIYETHPYYYPNHSFKEITAEIPKIKELGVKTIYLMPIWERAMKRQDTTLIYLINDYYKIDSAYGTTGDLRELIKTMHENDMKILFDFVTCCTTPGSAVYNNNWTYSFSSAELAEKAKELNWKLEYETVEGRNFVFAGKHQIPETRKDLYEFAGEIFGDRIMVWSFPIAGWGPAVDLGNPEVIKYFTGIAEHYVKEYDIDGWRIDAPFNNYNSMVFSGDHSSARLLISAGDAVKKIKPDAEFISEPGLPKEVTADAMYASLGRILPSITEGQMTSQEFVDKLIVSVAESGRTPAFLVESHDLLRINKSYPQLNKNLLVMISTLPGVPFIQTGQELGETKDWFKTGNANPQVDWDNGDYGLKDFYKKVFSIRNSNNALKYGDIKNVWKSGDNIYAYSRTYENETVVVVVNFNNRESTSVLDLPFAAGKTLKDELSEETFTISDPANFRIPVPAHDSKILALN